MQKIFGAIFWDLGSEKFVREKSSEEITKFFFVAKFRGKNWRIFFEFFEIFFWEEICEEKFLGNSEGKIWGEKSDGGGEPWVGDAVTGNCEA